MPNRAESETAKPSIVTKPDDRHFLFLQGPHGPFFAQLAKMVRAAGCAVSRVGFNAGDEAFWLRSPGYIPFRSGLDAWPERFRSIVDERQISDLVLYGDTRPIHALAIQHARQAGVRVHVFEEGLNL